ncbi:MAG: DUF4390 domain-containing protein [Gammaproteobacteria bacterium]|jgi:hypothetical protein
MSNHHRQIRRPRMGLLAAVCLWLLATLSWQSTPAHADPLEGALEIQSAFVNVVGGVYQLHVRTRYPANEETVAALRDGGALSYDVDVEVTRERRFWTDATIVTLRLERELSYHSVSERYVVRDPLVEGEQKSYATLEEALADLGSVDSWPILVASQLAEPGDYVVSVRASVRRGRLTDALRALMFWSDDWQRESEWYSWSLPR